MYTGLSEHDNYKTYFAHTGTKSTGIWEALGQFEYPVLKQLADKLPTTIWHSRANSTAIKYMHAFCCWTGWATQHHEIALFLLSHALRPLLATTKGHSSFQVSSQRGHKCNWMGQSTCRPDDSYHSITFCSCHVVGLQRHLKKLRVRKELITAAMLAKLVNQLSSTAKSSEICLVIITPHLCIYALQ